MIEYMTRPGLHSNLIDLIKLAEDKHHIGHAEPVRMAPWHVAAVMGDDIVAFEYGTLHGIFNTKRGVLGLIAVENEQKNNGHFAEFMDWFEGMAEALGLRAAVLEIENPRLYEHLKNKRGYTFYGPLDSRGHNLIKGGA